MEIFKTWSAEAISLSDFLNEWTKTNEWNVKEVIPIKYKTISISWNDGQELIEALVIFKSNK